MASLKEKIKNGKDKAKELLEKSIICLFRFCFGWTIIHLLMMIGEFLELGIGGKTFQSPLRMTNLYIGLLGTYASNKEVNRWTGVAKKKRTGEVFVYMWWGILIIMYITNYLTSGKYVPPTEMDKICLWILGIFFGTESSKFINSKIRPGKSESS